MIPFPLNIETPFPNLVWFEWVVHLSVTIDMFAVSRCNQMCICCLWGNCLWRTEVLTLKLIPKEENDEQWLQCSRRCDKNLPEQKPSFCGSQPWHLICLPGGRTWYWNRYQYLRSRVPSLPKEEDDGWRDRFSKWPSVQVVVWHPSLTRWKTEGISPFSSRLWRKKLPCMSAVATCEVESSCSS